MNRVALISGASRGIGRGIALELAKIGYNLVINYAANEGAARQTAQECEEAGAVMDKKVRAEACQADISSAADRKNVQ